MPSADLPDCGSEYYWEVSFDGNATAVALWEYAPYIGSFRADSDELLYEKHILGAATKDGIELAAQKIWDNHNAVKGLLGIYKFGEVNGL